MNKILLINEFYKSPLSNKIKKEYNTLIAIIAQIPTAQRKSKIIDGTGGKVSVADLIAYQIGWGKLLINWYEIGLKGKTPQMPGEGFLKWDYTGLAKHFYEKYGCNDSIQQEQEFFNVVKRIIDITEYEFETNNLDKLGVWGWCTLTSGKQWPLSKWITVNSASSYKRAISLINRFIKKQL